MGKHVYYVAVWLKTGFAVSGRRNAIGSFVAARGSGSLYGAIPAVLVGSGDNNDIKVPYRFPITEKRLVSSVSSDVSINSRPMQLLMLPITRSRRKMDVILTMETND